MIASPIAEGPADTLPEQATPTKTETPAFRPAFDCGSFVSSTGS